MTKALPAPSEPHLRRVLGLPLLVFYGLGVTVGAGIFALVGAVSRLAGDQAPLAFCLAGLMAALTAVSYARLARVYPVAAGEAAYVSDAFGSLAGRLAGFGVVVSGIVSSAAIALAFAGYFHLVMPLPPKLTATIVVAGLGLIALIGVRESVGLAALVTILEVGTLAFLAAIGLPELAGTDALSRALTLPANGAAWSPVFAASIIAFFAFIGFEDIVNMAEETRAPERNLALAIAITLAVTVLLYVALAMIVIAVPERQAVAASPAPLATLFTALTGRPGTIIAAIAAIAMLNGILIQIVMASRVLYGMARRGLAPAFLSHVHARRLTPVTAILFVAGVVAALALLVPILSLAKFTSLVVLVVFTLVNLSLVKLAGRASGLHRRWRWWGWLAGLCSLALLVVGIVETV